MSDESKRISRFELLVHQIEHMDNLLLLADAKAVALLTISGGVLIWTTNTCSHSWDATCLFGKVLAVLTIPLLVFTTACFLNALSPWDRMIAPNKKGLVIGTRILAWGTHEAYWNALKSGGEQTDAAIECEMAELYFACFRVFQRKLACVRIGVILFWLGSLFAVILKFTVAD